jgi:hypothetical protein
MYILSHPDMESLYENKNRFQTNFLKRTLNRLKFEVLP